MLVIRKSPKPVVPSVMGERGQDFPAILKKRYSPLSQLPFISRPFILITPQLSPLLPLFCSIFPSLRFVFCLTVTRSLLPQGNRVMSPMSFHSQLYNVLCVCVYLCETVWKKEYWSLCVCMCVCVCVSLTVSRPLKAYMPAWVRIVYRSCPSLWYFGWSFQDAAIMLTSSLSCHTPLEVL